MFPEVVVFALAPVFVAGGTDVGYCMEALGAKTGVVFALGTSVMSVSAWSE